MRSLLGSLVGGLSNLTPDTKIKTPVPFASARASSSLSNRDNRETQLAAMATNGTLFAIVDRLANAVSQVEWTLYTKASSGLKEDRKPVTAHACIDLWQRPNPFMPRQEFMETVQQHFELCGEGYPIINKAGSLPLELWPARPDRMKPIPHVTKFLAGWLYISPDGDKIPLGLDEVMQLRRPNPMDVYRGMSPVTPLMADLDSGRYAAEWNRNFFVNGAEPGGIISVEENLDDDEFRQLQSRWNEQHRGVSRAHRVAILERGMTWNDRTISQKDMQFVQLREASRDTIMEGYAFGKPMLGVTDDVNRANAEAGAVVFARWQLVNRLERWKAMLNFDLLPMYGGTSQNLEWDYANPVPEDREAERADMLAKADAAVKLIGAGLDPVEVLAAVGLPEIASAMAEGESSGSARQLNLVEMIQKVYLGVDTVVTWEEAREILNRFGAGLDLGVPQPGADEGPEQIQIPAPAGPPALEPAPEAKRVVAERIRAAVAEPGDIDVTPVQEAWQAQLDKLMGEWGTVTAAQRAELREQITEAVDAGDVAALTALSVSSVAAAELVAGYMATLADRAAERVVREAVEQGVDGVEPKTPEPSVLERLATATAAMLAAGLALAAGREAVRVQSPAMSGVQVADAVDQFLAAQSDATARTELGGALTGAQNAARVETFRAAPVAALYANEKNDPSTCKNCAEIDGRFIGLSDDGTVMDEVDRLYPMGGYVDCLGRSRCRGTITGVWRPQQTGGD